MKYTLLTDFMGQKKGEYLCVQSSLSGDDWNIILALMLHTGIIEEHDPNKKWEPEIGEQYWFLTSNGRGEYMVWDDDDHDRVRRDFLGVYKTEIEALEARDRIRAFIKGDKK